MLNVRTVVMCAIGITWAGSLNGQSPSQYRTFELGRDLASVSRAAGLAESEVMTLHLRPAVLQEIVWRPSRWIGGSAAMSNDPVERITFSFYNDQLFRIVVDYARERTEGMTAADMVEAMSLVYRTALPRSARAAQRTVSDIETDSGTPIARWGDAQHAVVLYETPAYGNPFRLVVKSAAVEDAARKAAIEARRLDAQEAPLREIAREKQERDDRDAAAAKARDTNKGAFRP
jgi:hypothetical protein